MPVKGVVGGLCASQTYVHKNPDIYRCIPLHLWLTQFSVEIQIIFGTARRSNTFSLMPNNEIFRDRSRDLLTAFTAILTAASHEIDPAFETVMVDV